MPVERLPVSRLNYISTQNIVLKSSPVLSDTNTELLILLFKGYLHRYVHLKKYKEINIVLNIIIELYIALK